MATSSPATQVPFVDLRRQYASIRDEIDVELRAVLEGSCFILGPKVVDFEQRFAELHGGGSCVGVNSGTSALHLALLALGIGPGDEVVVPGFTFVATAWPVAYCGARPVFCDVQRNSANLDPERLAEAITPRTRAVIAVHLYGRPCELERIASICEERGVALVEDCAQAHCAEYAGRSVGSFGRVACFSFYPGKNLGAYGEAGAVLTRDAELADRVRMLRDHGQSTKGVHDHVGYNYRMDGLQGAVLGVKLRHIEEWTERRRGVARRYREKLRGPRLPEVPGDSRHVYHLFVVRHAERDRLLQDLLGAGVAGGLHYPHPVHLQPAFARLGYRPGDLPESEAWAAECLSLPMFAEMTDAEVDYVTEQVNAFA